MWCCTLSVGVASHRPVHQQACLVRSASIDRRMGIGINSVGESR